MLQTRSKTSSGLLTVATEIVCWFCVQLILGLGFIVCAATYLGFVVAPLLLFGINYLAARQRAGERTRTQKEQMPLVWAALFNLVWAAWAFMELSRQSGMKPAAFIAVWIVAPSIVTFAVLISVRIIDGAIAVVFAAIAASITHLLIPDSMGMADMAAWNVVTSIGLWCWAIRTKLGRRTSSAICKRCEYPLFGLPTTPCPECGHKNTERPAPT